MKENEEKTKYIDVVEVKAHRSPDSQSPWSDARSSSRSVFLSHFIEMICQFHGSVIKVYDFFLILSWNSSVYSLFHIVWCCIIVRCALCCLVNLINGIFSPRSPNRNPRKSLGKCPRRSLRRSPRRSLSRNQSESTRIISSMSMSRSLRSVLSRIP